MISAKQAKSAYAALLAQRDFIESRLGHQVGFDEMPTKLSCKIFESTSGDVNDRETWPTLHKWLKDRGEAYAAVFTPLVRQLRLNE